MEYTKDKFLTDIKKMNKTNDKYEDKAYESIVKNLFLQGKRGKEKAMGLDEYDSESNSKLTLIPGHIYMFKYVTDTTTKYNDSSLYDVVTDGVINAKDYAYLMRMTK